MSKSRKRWIIVLFVVIGLCLFGFLAFRSWPAVGSSLADPMRDLLGIERVARLETFLFNIQDRISRWKYSAGLEEAAVPWSVESLSISPDQTVEPNPVPPTETAPPLADMSTKEPSNVEELSPTATLRLTPTPSAWTLPNLETLGSLPNEGIWQPYITNPDGEVVAVRTFLQPDPERPYSIVAVVAFDLSQTRLNFVLGLEEPGKPGGPHGYGVILDEDKQPGKLLAAFNGGFIAEHGQYGAMANGVVPLAARAGLATLGIYKDGRVRIGEWKNDLSQNDDYVAWRQNALMIIHNGETNPKVETGTYIEWGANLDGSIVTIRSAVGLSEDNQVLFYFAGPSLSMPTLADAMKQSGVYNGMLLDINPTHAHFTIFALKNSKLTAEPLFPEEMNIWVDRYLGQWDQDFFYLTTKSP